MGFLYKTHYDMEFVYSTHCDTELVYVKSVVYTGKTVQKISVQNALYRLCTYSLYRQAVQALYRRPVQDSICT